MSTPATVVPPAMYRLPLPARKADAVGLQAPGFLGREASTPKLQQALDQGLVQLGLARPWGWCAVDDDGPGFYLGQALTGPPFVMPMPRETS